MVDRAAVPPPHGTITATEVLGWFCKHQRPWPSEAHCARIADRLNVIAGGGWSKAEYDAAIDGKIAERYAAAGVPVPEPQSDPREWWDFAGTEAAARTLLAALPAMREHWSRLEWAPETAGGSAVMDALSAALAAAMPRIEWPFGEYERPKGQKAPKDYHKAAVAVLPLILWAMHEAGQKRLGRSGNSIAIAVLCEGLKRAAVPNMATLEDAPAAIAGYLEGWFGWQGLTAAQIAAQAGAPQPGADADASAV